MGVHHEPLEDNDVIPLIEEEQDQLPAPAPATDPLSGGGGTGKGFDLTDSEADSDADTKKQVGEDEVVSSEKLRVQEAPTPMQGARKRVATSSLLGPLEKKPAILKLTGLDGQGRTVGMRPWTVGVRPTVGSLQSKILDEYYWAPDLWSCLIESGCTNLLEKPTRPPKYEGNCLGTWNEAHSRKASLSQ